MGYLQFPRQSGNWESGSSTTMAWQPVFKFSQWYALPKLLGLGSGVGIRGISRCRDPNNHMLRNLSWSHKFINIFSLSLSVVWWCFIISSWIVPWCIICPFPQIIWTLCIIFLPHWLITWYRENITWWMTVYPQTLCTMTTSIFSFV